MTRKEKIEISVLEDGISPTYTKGVYKLYAYDSGTVLPGASAKINVGFKVKIPYEYFGKIQRTVIKTLGGVVDSDYRGVLCVIVHNDTNSEFIYSKGDEVGEMIICKIITPEITISAKL